MRCVINLYGITNILTRRAVDKQPRVVLRVQLDVDVGMGRTGATPEQIIEAVVAKQVRNEGRLWPDWRTADPNKAIEHVREPLAEGAPS